MRIEESRPVITVHATLDRPRELRLSFRALRRYATATGKDMFSHPDALRTADDLKTLIWSMARETDPAVTLEQLAVHCSTSILLQVASSIRAVTDGDTSPTDRSTVN